MCGKLQMTGDDCVHNLILPGSRKLKYNTKRKARITLCHGHYSIIQNSTPTYQQNNNTTVNLKILKVNLSYIHTHTQTQGQKSKKHGSIRTEEIKRKYFVPTLTSYSQESMTRHLLNVPLKLLFVIVVITLVIKPT